MTEVRAPITPEAVVDVFKKLSDEHVTRRSSHDSDEAWTRLQIRSIVNPRMERRNRPLFWGALAAAVAVAGVLVWSSASTPLHYEVRGAEESQGLIKTANEPATVSFSDGSVIEAAENTALAVTMRGQHGALARLTRGRLRVEVDHQEDTDWRFLAGPYEVVVVGTSFDLSWDPNAQSLHLALHEGHVRVLEEGAEARSVRAGQVLDLRAPLPASPTAASAEAANPSPDVVPVAPKPTRVEAPEARRPSARSWAQLVGSGKFEEVLRAAEAMGISSAMASRDAGDLKALAQAARYVGRADVSLNAWQALRRRFPSSQGAEQAAFFLARIYEQQGRASTADHWLDVYLAESPSGVYAAEALGRKLSMTRRLRGKAAAAGLARDYIERYPTGPYAGTARDILQPD